MIFRKPFRVRGFTLLEFITVMTITAIVAGMVAVFIMRPVEGYVDLSRRAALVDSADSALRRMARDIRLALPDSLRVTNTASGFALEMLPTLDGARYATAEATACENLTGFDPLPADDVFAILGTFSSIAPGTYPNYRIVINNQGAGTTHDVYTDGVTPSPAAPLVITPVGTTIDVAFNPTGPCPATANHSILLSAAHQFRSASPRGRMFVITTPVTYLCDTTASTLTRYADYPIQATQPTTAATLNALAGVTSARIADHLSACSVDTSTTNVQERGLATITLTLAEKSEQIRLIHQVQLDNSR